MNAAKPTIEIRKDVVTVLRELKGLRTDRQLAEAMGTHHGNLSRTFAGKQRPGPQFIASLCVALGCSMNDLFVVVEPEERRAA